MGPKACRLVWLEETIRKVRSPSPVYVFVLQVSISDHMHMKSIQAKAENGLAPGMVVGRWMGKERSSLC